jgi:hypothetical protein
MPLARLLRYAYGLRDVAAIDETGSPTTHNGLHDLLIELLAKEVEELLHRGLPRRYIPIHAWLESPRGTIVISEVIRRTGIQEANLPCLHFERRADWHLNQVLRAGLETAAHLAEDRHLRHRVHRLSAMFGDVVHLSKLRHEDIERAERDLTRLTAVCRPALTIIGLLIDKLGIAFDSSQPLNRMVETDVAHGRPCLLEVIMEVGVVAEGGDDGSIVGVFRRHTLIDREWPVSRNPKNPGRKEPGEERQKRHLRCGKDLLESPGGRTGNGSEIEGQFAEEKVREKDIEHEQGRGQDGDHAEPLGSSLPPGTLPNCPANGGSRPTPAWFLKAVDHVANASRILRSDDHIDQSSFKTSDLQGFVVGTV